MDSVDLSQLERRARRKYEWARVRTALLGFAPALAVVAVACSMNKHPRTALLFGAGMFIAGVALLWYGRSIRRAVLPGFAMGLLPLALALCANHMGHACMGGQCMSLCLPACTLGGVLAGAGISLIGMRWKQGVMFWLGATALTFLTGAMGCSCIGYAGVAGLGMGYLVGSIPLLLRRLGRSSRY